MEHGHPRLCSPLTLQIQTGKPASGLYHYRSFNMPNTKKLRLAFYALATLEIMLLSAWYAMGVVVLK